MSLDATIWAWQQTGLKPSRKLLLLSLADRANEMHCAWPSESRLVNDTGLNLKTIKIAIKELELSGYIKIERKRGCGNKYHLIGVQDRHRTRPKNGPGPKTVPGPKTDQGRPKSGLGTGPKSGLQNLPIELINNLAPDDTKPDKNSQAKKVSEYREAMKAAAGVRAKTED